MQVFWEKGYEAASLSDLTKGMRISRSSLYETFGDKQALFEEAMHCYRSQIASQRIAILKNAKSAREGIRRYFESMSDVCGSPGIPGGCFFTNAAAALNSRDEKTAAVIQRGTAALEEAFMELFLRGCRTGEISEKKDVRALARLFLVVTYGLNVLSKVERCREKFEETARTAEKFLD